MTAGNSTRSGKTLANRIRLRNADQDSGKNLRRRTALAVRPWRIVFA